MFLLFSKFLLQVDEEECSVRETKPENSVKCSKNDCDTWEVKHRKYIYKM